MKNIITLSIALLCFSLATQAQTNGKIDLSIIDQQQKPLTETFVALLNAKDSTMVQFATTNNTGNVQFGNLKKGKYIAFVPHIGSTSYETYPFEMRNYDEAYDITLMCKACTEIIITGHSIGKTLNKIG